MAARAGLRRGQIDLFTKRVRQRPPVPEFNIHCMVADMLRRFAAPGWRFTHIPLGEYRTPATAARLQRMGTKAGFPDFLLVSPGGHAFFLELKRHGGRLTEAQKEFAAWCSLHQIPFAIAHNPDEAIAAFRQWGAIRTGVKVQ